jgi:hypothetical protein
MRKILFLDIDGVVNNSKSHEKYSYRGMLGIDPNLAFLVGKIVLDTGCEVVLSSSWEEGITPEIAEAVTKHLNGV